jgi:O-antigen/teichoic acid export membrane protein
LISPADFGIASIFAMTFYLMEMISNLATETLLVQAEDGDDPQFQATAQLLLAVRGSMNALIILFLARPISHLFSVPQANWAFACLALVPFVKAFTNLDPSRMQRHLRFDPFILTSIMPSVAVTLLAYPLARWLKDYSAMLWLLVIQTALTVVVSHVVSERRYSWGWNPEYARRFFRFGWPLLVNGLLMYLILQGDRFVIGAAKQLFPSSDYTLGDLGVYSVAFALTLAPQMVIANVGSQLFLPILSRVQNDRKQFDRRYSACAQVVALSSGLISIPFVVAGGPLVTLIYGTKYAAAAKFISWLGAMQFLRTMKVAPTLAATALGDTENAMYANIARTTAFLGVLLVAATGQDISWIAACGFFGEILAFSVAVLRLQSRQKVSAATCVRPGAFMALGVAIAALFALLGVQTLFWPYALLVSVCLTLVAAISMFVLFPELRSGIRTLLNRNQSSVLV